MTKKEQKGKGAPVEYTGWEMAMLSDQDRNVPDTVVWFETQWNQIGAGNVVRKRNERKGVDFAMAAFYSGERQIISIVKIDKIGRVKEQLYVYDRSELIRADRIKTGGEVIDSNLGCLLPMSAFRFDIKHQKLDRESIIVKSTELLEKLVEESGTKEYEARIRIFIDEAIGSNSQSVFAIPVGFPGGGGTK